MLFVGAILTCRKAAISHALIYCSSTCVTEQAEAVIPLDAYNSTSAVPDVETDDDELETGQVVLIVVICALVLCCVCGLFVKFCTG